jgi:putative ABC transport system permease protein
MTWGDTLRTGLEAIRSHRMRSGLTMLGILIGIAAVILTVGLGEGAQAQVKSQINALGSNLLIVSPGSTTSSSGARGGFGSASTLTMADATALRSKVVAPDVAAVAPISTRSESLTAGTANWTTSVVGSTDQWATVRSRSLAEGRFFTAAEVSSAATVTVLASDTAEELFGRSSPVGQTVSVGDVPMEVIGVLNAAGSSATSNDDDQAVVPVTTAATRLTGGSTRGSVSTIYVQATSSKVLSAAYQEVDAQLSVMHKVTNPTSADFSISTQDSILATATSVDRTLTVLLAGVAGISLLVGGIGVMNIMLVSVTERIREIGLRKALGAPPRTIRRQFLVEASVLGLCGGLLGAAIGLLGARLLPGLVSQPIAISPTAVVGSLVVSLAIGVLFGVYPASRAARLAPIDALRSE